MNYQSCKWCYYFVSAEEYNPDFWKGLSDSNKIRIGFCRRFPLATLIHLRSYSSCGEYIHVFASKIEEKVDEKTYTRENEMRNKMVCG